MLQLTRSLGTPASKVSRACIWWWPIIICKSWLGYFVPWHYPCQYMHQIQYFDFKIWSALVCQLGGWDLHGMMTLPGDSWEYLVNRQNYVSITHAKIYIKSKPWSALVRQLGLHVMMTVPGAWCGCQPALPTVRCQNTNTLTLYGASAFYNVVTYSTFWRKSWGTLYR